MNSNIPDLHPPSSRRRGIMLCQPFDEKRLQKWHTQAVLVQPKLDGERCRALVTPQGVQLLSSEVNEIISVPHISEQLQWLCQHWELPSLELDGELYTTGMDFSEIHSRVSRKENIHDNYAEIKFHVFDIIEASPQTERIGHLISLFNQYVAPDVQLVNSKVVDPTVDAIMESLNIFTAEGNEGIIVRHPFASYERKRSLHIMKWKPKKNDIYRIIGCQEEIDGRDWIDSEEYVDTGGALLQSIPIPNPNKGKGKNSLGAFICCGEDGTPFGVGTGFTALQRQDYWQRRHQMPGMYIEVAYQNLTSKKVPRFPVYCKLVESPFND